MSRTTAAARRSIIPATLDEVHAADRLAVEVRAQEALDRGESLSPAPADPGSANLIIIPMEEFHCCHCNGAIPREWVIGMMMNTDTRPRANIASLRPHRIYRAYCEHCDLLYEVTTTLSGGIWRQASQCSVIRDNHLRKQHFARVRTALRGLGFQAAC